MKIVKPMTLGLMHRPYRWQGKNRLLVTTLSFFTLGERVEILLPDNLQWTKVMAALPHGRPLDELMPKMRGEVLLAGSAYANGGLPTTAQTVRLQVGGIDKRLQVFGDRQWTYGMLPLFQITEPGSFTQMPLDWEHAFGGRGHSGNPLGRGYSPNPLAAFIGCNQGAMPNVENISQRVRGPNRRYRPAGFGAMDVGWLPRSCLSGTYDKQWLAADFPGLANDTSTEFFNAAPEDQRIVGHFEGGEAYRLEGMHPTQPVIEGWLPEFRPRAFVLRDNSPADAIDEIALAFDTVWFFPAVELGVAIHRGEIEIQDSMALDVKAVMVAYEHAADMPRAVAHYGQVLALRTNRDTAARHVFNEAQLTPAPSAATTMARAREAQQEQLQQATVRSQREAALSAEFEQASGIPAPAPSYKDVPLQTPSAAAIRRGDFDLGPLLDDVERVVEQAREGAAAKWATLASATAELPAQVLAAPDTVAQVLARAAGPGEALKALQTMSAEASPPVSVEQLQDLQRRARLAAPDPTAPVVPLSAEVADALGQWVLARLRDGISLHGCDFAGANLQGALLSGADLRGALLEGSNFSGAQLDGADFSDAALTGAIMHGANCAAARFNGANLAHTQAHDANFSGASFDKVQAGQADWTASDFTGATFQQWIAPNIVLSRANFTQATLSDCVLLYAKASASCWTRSVANRTVMLGSDFTDSHWTEAKLTRCVLMECPLTNSQWNCASVSQLQAGGDGADWSGANLRQMAATRSSWRDATMVAVNLSDGEFRECDFSGAKLRDASAERTLFYRSLFMRTEMTGCRADAADFYQAMCRRADFRHTKLRGANFFKADCTEAHFEHALLHDIRIEPGRVLPR